MKFETFEDDANNIVPMMADVISFGNSYSRKCKFMYQELDTIIGQI